MIPFNIVVAVDEKLGIGKAGGLPWHLPSDLKHFKEITTRTTNPEKQNAVVMGRKTWDSLPEKFKPLPKRINVVLTRRPQFSASENVVVSDGLQHLFLRLPKEKAENIFVIGGGEVFKEAVKSPFCQKLFLTHIRGDFKCDTFFPEFRNHFELADSSPEQEENGIKFNFAAYKRK